jgi:hypothetical protein
MRDTYVQTTCLKRKRENKRLTYERHIQTTCVKRMREI